MFDTSAEYTTTQEEGVYIEFVLIGVADYYADKAIVAKAVADVDGIDLFHRLDFCFGAAYRRQVELVRPLRQLRDARQFRFGKLVD